MMGVLLAELFAQFDVVVDFTVVGNPVAGAICHRLCARHRQLDDAEALMSEPDLCIGMRPDSFAIGPSMTQQALHGAQPGLQTWDGLQPRVHNARDSTHIRVPRC